MDALDELIGQLEKAKISRSVRKVYKVVRDANARASARVKKGQQQSISSIGSPPSIKNTSRREQAARFYKEGKYLIEHGRSLQTTIDDLISNIKTFKQSIVEKKKVPKIVTTILKDVSDLVKFGNRYKDTIKNFWEELDNLHKMGIDGKLSANGMNAGAYMVRVVDKMEASSVKKKFEILEKLSQELDKVVKEVKRARVIGQVSNADDLADLFSRAAAVKRRRSPPKASTSAPNRNPFALAAPPPVAVAVPKQEAAAPEQLALPAPPAPVSERNVRRRMNPEDMNKVMQGFENMRM